LGRKQDGPLFRQGVWAAARRKGENKKKKRELLKLLRTNAGPTELDRCDGMFPKTRNNYGKGDTHRSDYFPLGRQAVRREQKNATVQERKVRSGPPNEGRPAKKKKKKKKKRASSEGLR